MDSFIRASVTFGKGSASVQDYKQGSQCKFHVYGGWATDFAQLSSYYHYNGLKRKEAERQKKQKELEAEGFEPPAFRKHLEQCKANVIPLHQAPVSLLFERQSSV